MIVPSQLRVLVVDDNKHARALAVAGLRSLGIGKIVEARGGAQAVAKLFQEPFDVVLTDWFMPDVSGAGLVEIIHGSTADGVRAVHIIVMTAYAAPENIARARALGVNEIIVKPITESHIAMALGKLVSRRSEQEATQEKREDDRDGPAEEDLVVL